MYIVQRLNIVKRTYYDRNIDKSFKSVEIHFTCFSFEND